MRFQQRLELGGLFLQRLNLVIAEIPNFNDFRGAQGYKRIVRQPIVAIEAVVLPCSR